MIRSKRQAVTILANGEQLYDMVTGQAGVTRRITELWVESAENVIFRAYLDTDRIVDVHGDCDQTALFAIPVDHVLVEGEVFSMGILDEAGGDTTLDMVVFYEETR